MDFEYKTREGSTIARKHNKADLGLIQSIKYMEFFPKSMRCDIRYPNDNTDHLHMRSVWINLQD